MQIKKERTMSNEKPKLPGSSAEQIVADMNQRAISAGTTLTELLKKITGPRLGTETENISDPDITD